MPKHSAKVVVGTKHLKRRRLRSGIDQTRIQVWNEGCDLKKDIQLAIYYDPHPNIGPKILDVGRLDVGEFWGGYFPMRVYAFRAIWTDACGVTRTITPCRSTSGAGFTLVTVNWQGNVEEKFEFLAQLGSE